MKLLYKAGSMIERDALRARLSEAGISSESPARDMSRKVTGSTVDLSLEGYSVFFDGFSVLVGESDEAEAKKILDGFLSEMKEADAEPAPGVHWRRFYFSSIFSILFPGLMSVPATYHLLRALGSGEKPQTGKLVSSLFCFAVGWTVFLIVVISSDFFGLVR